MASSSNRRPILLDFEKPLAELEARIDQIRNLAEENEVDVSEQIRQLEARAVQLRQEIFSSLSPSQRLQLARHPRRPSTLDYIHAISDEWFELHGDFWISTMPEAILLVFLLAISLVLTEVFIFIPLECLNALSLPSWLRLVLIVLFVSWCFGE